MRSFFCTGLGNEWTLWHSIWKDKSTTETNQKSLSPFSSIDDFLYQNDIFRVITSGGNIPVEWKIWSQKKWEGKDSLSDFLKHMGSIC